MKTMLAAAAALLAATAASATITTTDYAFSATFDTGPYATLGGTFSIAADDVAGTNVLTALDFSIGSTVYDVTNTSTFDIGEPYLAIGANLSDPSVVFTHTDDFFFIFGPSLTGAIMNYSTADTTIFFSTSASIRLASDTTPAVPEPASWALMLAGFGAIGAGIRRRRASVRYV